MQLLRVEGVYFVISLGRSVDMPPAYLLPKERRVPLGHHTLKEFDLGANREGVLGAGHNAVPVTLVGSVLALEFIVARFCRSSLEKRGFCICRNNPVFR